MCHVCFICNYAHRQQNRKQHACWISATVVPYHATAVIDILHMLESSLSRSPLFVHFFEGEELGEKCKLRYDLNVIFGTLERSLFYW